ncbi:uncharacterized protein CC84DRAFT_1216282 [Paraphaeosphaeria sporulosa]|uniref:Uncharacterized protein n=1 Tax=Paraphaeosphaeria sporulosa TaxID=1460663 RepID=A0A177CK05_9PLEO|nr:uncharacterized protein CC84DRAFT_1216282 [Paraphaeosphaeria sporulosa]OAG07302.1 hypothetical protein CC84DRAFT_1216282 [Paraphaeosphaeria sporulosa]
MKDHYDYAVDPRDLTKRLNRIQKSHSTPNDGDHVSRLPRHPGRAEGTTASSPTASLSQLPTFRKSATMSTTSSASTQFSGMRACSSAHESKASAEVRRGNFSKPRAGSARRRYSGGSEGAKSVPEFQYYGRHANSWLFNDWSLSDSVKKGWGRVFKGRE